MPKFTEFTFPSTDGKTKIYVRRFDPDGEPRGIVQLAHGIAEYSERYDAFARYLAEHGFIVCANDHLGHGKSVTDKKAYGYFAETDGWDVVVSDMHRLHDIMFSENTALPYFLFGHSMGSFLTRTYIIRYPAELTGAIICGTGQQSAALVSAGKKAASTFCGIFGARHKSPLLNMMAFGSYNKGIKPKRTAFDWLTRDNETVDKYIADPLCGFLPTAGLFRDMMGGIEFIGSEENVAKMRKNLPVLMISGDKDPVGENGEGVRRAYELIKRAGLTDVTMKLYPDCRHELLNELSRDEVMADVERWIESKV